MLLCIPEQCRFGKGEYRWQPTIVTTQPGTEKPTLKRIAYRGNCPGADGIVDYVILPGNRCVYSGVSRNSNSTINAEERIIEAICEREWFEPRTIEFFDLETCRGYDFHLEYYEFSRIVLKFDSRGRIQDVIWDYLNDDCPAEVLAIFKEHIGTFTVPVISWAEAIAQGFGGDDRFFSVLRTPEDALAVIRKNSLPKPIDTHTWAIVDLATKPGHVIKDGDRYEARVKFTHASCEMSRTLAREAVFNPSLKP